MNFNNDELCCQFTAWMKVVVKRAKIDYLRWQKRHSNEVSIEDEQLIGKLIYEPINDEESIENKFEFNNARLSRLFSKLSNRKRKILEMFFVYKMEPEDIAKELQCSLQNVYNMRSLALKELKNKLNGDDT